MNIDPRLHHYCQNITKGHLGDIVEMYKLLGFDVVYTPPPSKYPWIMVGQPTPRFAIQITEVDDKPIEDLEKKRQTHIAFISDNPKELIKKIETWTKEKGLTFREGGWSEIERYFDLPDIFVNFVVEVMHTSIEETK
jgi:hypothetical protein